MEENEKNIKDKEVVLEVLNDLLLEPAELFSKYIIIEFVLKEFYEVNINDERENNKEAIKEMNLFLRQFIKDIK